LIWLQFVLSAAALVFAANKLAEYADIIAIRTRLGGMFIGTLLLAGATSLPELLTIISSLGQQSPDMAAGNLFGSCMFNMLLLGILDMAYRQTRILRRVVLRHALTASLATLLQGLAAFFILARLEVRLGWVGADSLVLVAAYVAGVRILQRENPRAQETEALPGASELPPLWRAFGGFGLTSAILLVATPLLVRSALGIAAATGLGAGFIGTALVGMVTSLPEMMTMFAAARLGAYDLAVGNLFGSNLFNMFGLGLTDFIYTRGRFLGEINPAFALAGLLGMLLTVVGLVNNLTRSERRLLLLEVDAIVIVTGYFLGLYLLYSRGLVG
jgi:cation:H+ antiporter